MVLLLAALACDTDTSSDSVAPGDAPVTGCNPASPELGMGVAVWTDADGDGFGEGEMQWACDVAEGMASVPGDCDDGDDRAFPGADEVCDGVDNNCSGVADDSPVDAPMWFADFDQDGQGAARWGLASCQAPRGYVANDDDCDDGDDSVFAGADEVCNGVDDNCDDTVDEPSAIDAGTWFADDDGDGFGDAGVTTPGCDAPEGYVADDTDCDDAYVTVHPGADEICDGLDNDCDTAIDFDAWMPGDYADLDDVFANAPADAHVCIEAGTHGGGAYERDAGLTLHGSGVDTTTIDLDTQHLVFVNDGDFGLTDIELVNGRSMEPYGLGLVVFEDEGWLTLRSVRFSDASCNDEGDCLAGLVYWDDGGGMTATDVEVDGFTYAPEKSSLDMYGVFVGVDGTELHLSDVDIHGLDVYGGGDVYSTAIYLEGQGSLSIDGLTVRDSTVSGDDVVGAAVYIEDVYGAIEVHNLRVQDNTFETEDAGYTLGVFMDEVLSSDLSNVAIVDNTLTCSDDGELFGLAVGALGGNHDWQNLLVAGNSVSAQEGNAYAGIATIAFGSAAVTNSEMVDNTLSGFDTINSAGFLVADADLSVWNTTFADNAVGTAQALLVSWDGSLDADANNVYNTGTDLPFAWDEDEGELSMSPAYSVDPRYSDPSSGDYSLASGSPLVDAGMSSVYDADGSVSDVGAYGGPLGQSW